ncbi:MAG TPA: 2-oxoglutarate and iron-dependent oxygenase domain-containing protein [Chitinophagaceae bacterium]|nr:2-oxoglutarate and iron-dependent oxygenase domain-containing protein [Chitinophagaceae bacterium]
MENIIATLNLTEFCAGEESKKAFVQKLGAAFKDTGFFFLENHGIPEEVIATADTLFRQFFTGLSIEERLQYEVKEKLHQVGYTPMKLETGEFSAIPDEKHFFQAGDRNDIPFVKEIPAFTPACMRLFDEFRKVSVTLYRATALSLGLPENYFDDKEGNSVMRAIHYPAHESPLADDGEATAGGNYAGMCASKHTDINMITLLLARERGLELWHGNTWAPITITNPNVLIVNCGDMLEYVTGGRYKSGLHRVVCEKNVERFSVPYFSHMNECESIVPLSLLGDSDMEKYYFKTVGQFLHHRLQQIGL